MGSLFCAVGRKEGVAGPKGRKQAKRPRREDEWKQERGCSGADRKKTSKKAPPGKTGGSRKEGVAGAKRKKKAQKAPALE